MINNNDDLNNLENNIEDFIEEDTINSLDDNIDFAEVSEYDDDLSTGD